MRDPLDMVVGGRTTAFVGRVDELAAIDRLLGSRAERGAAVVLIAGEAGVGKSRLASELRHRAEAAGALVATGRTPLDGAALPYGTVVGLVRDLARRLGPRETTDLLDPVQAFLLGSPQHVAQPGAVARLQLFEAVVRAVVGLATERPLVLVLEDLHWADAGTLELLDYLVRNLDDQSVLIAATYRSDELERPPVRRVLAELRRHPAVIAFDLTGLSRDEIAVLLTNMTGEPQSWAVIDAVHARSEGNPLFAEELVGVRDANALPPALRDLLAVRIGQLPPDARAVVSAAAVLGVGCDHRLLGLVAEIDAAAVETALAEAVRHNVLSVDGPAGVVRFRHALLREAAHADLLPAERVRLHHRAADALAADPDLVFAGPGFVAAELAEHRYQAGEWPAACAASIDAARASLRLHSVHAAHAHLRRAIDAHRLAAGTCTHDDVDDAELFAMTADAAALVGELESALSLAQAALDALGADGPPRRAFVCSTRLAYAAANAGQRDRAFAALASAEQRLGDQPASADVAEVVTMHARLLMGAGRCEESIVRCEEALPHARAAGARVVEGHILTTLGPCHAQLGALTTAIDIMRDAVALADDVGDPALLIRAYNNLTHVLGLAGRLDDMAELAVDTMHAAGPAALLRLGGVGFNGTEALILLGRWDEAERLSVLMEGKASAACTSDSVNAAVLAVRRGEFDAAEAELQRRLPTNPAAVAAREAVVAEIALERDQPDEALAAVDRALARLAGTDYTIERLTAHALGLRALADDAGQPVRRGRAPADPGKIARLVESIVAEIDTEVAGIVAKGASVSPWIVALGAQCRAEATRALGADPDAWSAAAEAWDAFHAPFHVAYCQFRRAEALLAGRTERRAAIESLVEAWRTARRLGAASLVGHCERLAERARITLDGTDDDCASPRQRVAADLGLTPREAEVLELLALGRTDGQIAAELFVSKKTASVHVSNILRKLDARDRWHAGEMARASGLGTVS